MSFKFFLAAILISYLFLLALIFGHRFLKRRSRRPSQLRSPLSVSPSDPLIEMIDVDKSFEHPVLEGINLKISSGKTLGVLGKSGSGKSVLLKLSVGFLKPDTGRILFRGRDLTQMKEIELLEVRRRVSYVFQSGAFFDSLDIRGNIAYPLHEQGIGHEKLIQERVEYLMEAVELGGMGALRHNELSAGSKKQVAIARAIAINPEAILYDEPTTGVDPIVGKSLSHLIRKLNQQEKLTSIVVTHDLKCLEIVADRIILLKDGRIHFSGTKEEFHSSADAFVQAFIAGRRFDEEKIPVAQV